MSDFPPESVRTAPSTGLADYQPEGIDTSQVEDADAEFVEEPQEGEDEVLETQPEQPDEEPAEPEEPEEAPPEGLSSKSQNRFQKLANRAKEKERENEDLKALIATMQSMTEVSRQQQEAQRPYLEHQQRVFEQAERRRRMIEQGYDPANLSDVRMYEVRQEAEQKSSKVDQLEHQLRQLVHQQEVRAFEDDLQARLANKLGKYEVPEEQIGSLYQLAYDTAFAKGIDTEQATEHVLEMMRPFLREKKQQLKKRQSDKTPTEAHRAIAMAGRSGGRPAKEVDVSSFDSILDGLYG